MIKGLLGFEIYGLMEIRAKALIKLESFLDTKIQFRQNFIKFIIARASSTPLNLIVKFLYMNFN